MCFSAGASFGASVILTGIGIASLYKAQAAPHKVLACIPLFFAYQQFNEGILWLSLTHAAHAQWYQLSMYTFLVFAQVIWPIFVPLTMLLPEKDPVRKKILLALLGVGILLSAYLLYCLATYNVAAVVAHHHIRYDLSFPYGLKWYIGLLYFIPTVIPPFVSSIKRMWWIGAAILLTYVVSRLFYKEFVISVWCYFAAIISVLVLVVITGLRKSTSKLP